MKANAKIRNIPNAENKNNRDQLNESLSLPSIPHCAMQSQIPDLVVATAVPNINGWRTDHRLNRCNRE